MQASRHRLVMLPDFVQTLRIARRQILEHRLSLADKVASSEISRNSVQRISIFDVKFISDVVKTYNDSRNEIQTETGTERIYLIFDVRSPRETRYLYLSLSVRCLFAVLICDVVQRRLLPLRANLFNMPEKQDVYKRYQ